MLKRLTGITLVLSALAPATFAQSPPDLTKILERLDRLEKQNQQLLDEIRELRQMLGATAAAPAAAGTSPPLTERLDVQESRTAELAQSKVETSQRMPLSLTGMLLFNAYHNGRSGGGLQDPVAAGLTPSAATVGASFRQTVLGLRFNGPDLPGGGKSTGSVYMDFWGGTSAPSNNLFRLRLATLSLNWKDTTISVGQDKPIVSPREPMTLAQVGLAPLTGAGNLWNWNPQVRIEQNVHFGEQSGVRAEAGVFENTEAAPANATTAQTATLERFRPGYQGRFNFYTGSENHRLEIAPGFHFSASHFLGQSAASKLATLDWLARPSGFIDFSGAFFKGENAAGLGGLRQGFSLLPNASIIPIHTTGGWSQMTLYATKRLSIHFYGGLESQRVSDLLPGNIRRNLIWAGNGVYKLAPNVLAALEVSQNRTAYLFSGTRLNNHYDLALAWLF